MVRLIGIGLVAVGLLLVLRSSLMTAWIVRVNADLFDRETGTWERRGTSVIVVATGVFTATLGIYYAVRGAAGLPA